MKWIKVYFTREQYNVWKSGNGKAIGYTEEEAMRFQRLDKLGFNLSLKSDPIDHMTKVDPKRVTPIGWSLNGVYVD